MGASVKLALGFVLSAFIAFMFLDTQISTLYPWQELSRMAYGMITPDFERIDEILIALLKTLAFAFLGIAFASLFGFMLSFVFHYKIVQTFCAFFRAIHELFWALIFIQLFGLHPLAGLLAIILPYACILAKVYAEILEESDTHVERYLSTKVQRISLFLYAKLPDALPHLISYTSYRFECALRSSAILGFIGLPTLGFYLESSFMQGNYAQASALLWVFFILIFTLKMWLKKILLPFYIVSALVWFVLSGLPSVNQVVTFFTHDIIPRPLREDAGSLWDWVMRILREEAMEGIMQTVLLSQVALVLSGVIALIVFPFISKWFLNKAGRVGGHGLLVILRSTPEYILAYIFLQLFGPSMLPAILALAIHNGAIVGHLIGKYTNPLKLRKDSTKKRISLYAYEILPRLWGQFLAFLFYRWEVIVRESAILGILGVATLGFYIDSAMQDLRFDKAIFLILITAVLNIAIDWFSRSVRQRLRLRATASCEP